MTPDRPVFFLARIVLEAETPLSISTGIADSAFDTLLVRDANGLPAIPGSSLAGVLRTLYQGIHPAPPVDSIFGYAEGNDGCPSAITISWGAIHDGDDRPVEGLLLGASGRALEDPLLVPCLDEHPVTRDHVRIGPRGAGIGKGKFDRSMIPAGHRFSLELGLWAPETEHPLGQPTWERLLGLLSHPGFRLGGHTRRGLGRVRVVRLHTGCFDLRRRDDFRHFSRLGRGLADTDGLAPMTPPTSAHDWLHCTLALKPEQGWRFGQGKGMDGAAGGKLPDLLPVVEPVVSWSGGQGHFEVTERVLIPASGVKGALAHRVAFHFNRLTGHFAMPESVHDCAGTEYNPAVRALFGSAKDDRGDEDRGEAGTLYLDDRLISQSHPGTAPQAPFQVHNQWHNSIDRFTGGVRRHVLYGEQLLWQGSFALSLHVDRQRLDKRLREEHLLDDAQAVRRALRLALSDLCEGRLALGGGSAKGHGYCTGKQTWSDNGDWLGGQS